MKKLFVMLCCMIMSASMFAFEFDGINLNAKTIDVTRQVAKRGYVTDPARNCFTGLCKGKEICLSFDFENVSEKNHVGALLVDVPMNHAEAFETCTEMLNVIYHQENASAAGIVYIVDKDGTKMLLSKTDKGVRLTYYTNYYQAKK